MPSPTIRCANTTDQENIRALIFSVLHEYELDPAPQAGDADLSNLEDYYQGGLFDVLETNEDGIIGTIGLAKLKGGVCELRRMYLTQKHRGRGYGKRLLKHAVNRARKLGFSRIELETATTLEEALELYKQFGFEPADRADSESRCDQVLALNL
jgi:putative acetyltransferase